MMTFLSYAHEQRQIAEEVNVALAVRGYDVFFDRSSLRHGLEYDAAIQKAIEQCDLFVFLISPESLKQGSYTLTELGFAKARWKNPSGRVLPVMAKPTLISRVDPYLRAVTIRYSQGNLPAEVAASVDALLKESGTVDAPPTEELQRERIAAYRGLWELTKLLPKWPRSEDVTYEHLGTLSQALRDWYFHEGGGMFFSRSAHTSYSALQDSLAAILMEQSSENITDEHYDAVRELCSALRSTLARDVGSRT